MTVPRSISNIFFFLVMAIFCTAIGSACNSRIGILTETPVQTTRKIKATPSPRLTKLVQVPPTWTYTPPVNRYHIDPSKTPSPTPNFHQTMIAQTTVAAGVHCQRHPDAWQLFITPIDAYAGWCMVLGAPDTLYEYRILSPDGWIVNTYGELTPNLSFAIGNPNVQVNLIQAYSYFNRSYRGSLEEAPEKAAICDANDRCKKIIDPLETLTRQEIKDYPTRNVLILDSEMGPLNIRRFYQILHFTVDKHQSDRLFILEYSTTKDALDDEANKRILGQIEIMLLSLNQR